METDIGMGFEDEFKGMIHNTYKNINNGIEDGVKKCLKDITKTLY